MFDELKSDRKAWGRLLGTEGLMDRRLRDVLQVPPCANNGKRVQSGWKWLVEGRAGLQAACEAGEAFGDADAERLFQNALAHFAARICGWLLPSLHENQSRCDEFLCWLARAASLQDGLVLQPARDLLRLELSPEPEKRLDQLLSAVPTSDTRVTIPLCLALLDGLRAGHELIHVKGWSLRVPLAAVNEQHTKGYILDLHLRHLQEGASGLIEHPVMWRRPFASDWLEVLQDAFSRADFDRPVVWWLTPRGSGTIPWPDGTTRGRSHTAAARVGFHVLRMNGDYDPACLLAAMVELDGSLNGVDGLDAKCRRGKTAGIRRIIVAHDPVNNLIVSPEVQAELAAGPNSVRLDEVANVEQAIDACTGFSRGLRDYLNWVVDLVDTNLPPYFSGRKLSDLYIQPEVFGSQHRLADSDEQSAQSGKSSRSILALGAATEEEELRRHYQNNSEQLRLKWNHEWPRARRSVIVGYPGEGKSVLARMTARALAERGLKELNEQVTGSANVTLPICLRLAEVAEHGSLKAATLAILPTINQLNLPQVVVDHLTDSLIQDHCWLILDGLDEVPTGKRERLRIELANFIQKPCHIILTSRPYGYTSELLPFGSVEEYRLAGLTPDQINAFLQSWFRSSRTPSREKAIRTLLHNNPAMVGLSQNALMLTLTCAEGDIRHLDPDNTRRVHLYYWIIRDLIRGAWQTDPVDIDDKRLDREFRALRRMAWSMFQHHPSRTVFPNDQLLQLLLDQQYTELEAEELLNSWGKRGLLLPGLDTKDQKAGSFFAHRIFLEYLVAEHLASIKGYLDHVHALLWRRDDAGKLCWEPAAIEVLNMLAGCLSDPMPLLEYYLQQDEERPFAFGVFSLLAGLALPDVDARVSNSEVGERITKAIWSNWPEGPLPETVTRALRHPHGISFLLRSFEAGDYRRQECITKVFTTYPDLRALDTLLRGLLESEDCIICEQCADALGLYDDPKTVTALLQAFYQDNPSSDSTPANALRSLYRLRPAEYSSLVQDCLRQHKFETVRYAAAASLGEFGGDWAVQPLLETLWFEKEAWVRETAAKSLISLLGPALPAVLLDVFERETDTNRRMRAVEALGFCPDRIASVALLESIGTLSDVDLLAAVVVSLGRMREQSAISIFTELAEKQTEASLLAALATALGELRHASSFPRLVELLTVGKNEKHVRRAAATALGKLGKPEAVPVLIDILKTDEDYWIRADAAKALGELRDERAINDLIYAVQNDENVVRWSAAEALAKMRSPSLLNVFLRALASDDEYLRREAVIGLRHFIDDQAVEPLLNALKHDNDSEVQFSAADALNEIIKSGLWIRRR